MTDLKSLAARLGNSVFERIAKDGLLNSEVIVDQLYRDLCVERAQGVNPATIEQGLADRYTEGTGALNGDPDQKKATNAKIDALAKGFVLDTNPRKNNLRKTDRIALAKTCANAYHLNGEQSWDTLGAESRKGWRDVADRLIECFDTNMFDDMMGDAARTALRASKEAQGYTQYPPNPRDWKDLAKATRTRWLRVVKEFWAAFSKCAPSANHDEPELLPSKPSRAAYNFNADTYRGVAQKIYGLYGSVRRSTNEWSRESNAAQDIWAEVAATMMTTEADDAEDIIHLGRMALSGRNITPLHMMPPINIEAWHAVYNFVRLNYRHLG